MLHALKSPGKVKNKDFYTLEQLANLRTIGALWQLAVVAQLADHFSRFCFFWRKKQNEKFSHENEAKNYRPKGALIVRGA